MAREERADNVFTLLRFERANGIDKDPAPPQPFRGAVEELALKLGAFRDDLRPRSVENFRVAPERARCRARSIEQDRIELPFRIPLQRVRLGKLRPEARASEVLAQPAETTGRRIEGGNAMARGGELHRLTARRGAEVEDV